MQDRIAATLIATLTITLASAQPLTSQVPAGFQTVTEVHGYQVQDPQPLAAPIGVDLATGAGAESCPVGAWTGAATFLNTDAGTIQYWGTGYWCMPVGFGTVQYGDGSTYFGMVNSFVASREAQFQRDQVRLAVRDGYGQAYQPATGQQWLGEFRAGVFKQDLATNQRFIAAYSAATQSITDKAAPRVTPEVEALLEFTVEAATPASKPKAGGGVRKLLFGAFAGRGGSKETAPATDLVPDGRLKMLPAALQGLEGIAELDMILRRYAKRTAKSQAPTIKQGFWGPQCLAEPGQEAVLGLTRVRWSQFPPRAYLGEHEDCHPKGVGRIEYENGDIWIGPVAWLQSQSESKGRVIPSFDSRHRFPVPDGLGLWYHKDSDEEMVLSLRYGPPKGGVFFVAEWAGQIWNPRFVAVIHKDGRVAVYDDKDPRDFRGGNILSEGQVPYRLTEGREGTLHLLDGSSIRGRLQRNEPDTGWPQFTWQHAALGITLHGEVQRHGKPNWTGVYFLELTKPWQGLAPGHYLGDVQRLGLVGVPLQEGGRLLVPGLARIDAQQYAGFVQRHQEAYQRLDASNKASLKANLDQMLAQERAEQAENDRIERQQRAERDAAFRAAMAGAMTDLKQTVDRSVADLEASRQRNQQAIDFSNQLAAQKAEQERRNREEQERRDREAREATRAYEIAQAQSKANFASAMNAAQSQQQDAARLQQQTASMNRQAAQGGSYTSPFEQNARAVGPGTGGAPALSALPSAQAPQQRVEPPKKTYPPVPQAVAVCLQRGGGKYACYGALGSPSSVGPDQPSGWKTPEEWLGYVGNCTGAQRRSLTDGSVGWTCGFGVSGIVKDVLAITGVQMQRGTYYCAPDESYCKRTTPTGQ